MYKSLNGCVYLSQKHCMKISDVKNIFATGLIHPFWKSLVSQVWRKSSSLEGNMCVYMWCSVYVCVCVQVVCSRVNAKGQEFFGVKVVEGAQVWQTQEEFWEEGWCHPDGVGWLETAGHKSDPPGAAPRPTCPRCQNGLKSTADARVSGWQTQAIFNYLVIK